MLKLLLNFLMLTQSALFWGLNTQLIRFLIQLLKILHWKQGKSSFFGFSFFLVELICICYNHLQCQPFTLADHQENIQGKRSATEC